MDISAARRLAFALVFTLSIAAPAASQTLPPYAETANLSGPRFGFTILSPGITDTLARDYMRLNPVMTQFGWQFERQFWTNGGPVTMVNEWVLLLGGLEQGVALPSLNWLVGVRTHDGTEFGVGPNLTPLGTALVFAGGRTFRAGAMNVPVNVAVVPSKMGVRVTLLTGFSMRSR